jgi:hypothetical protein
MTIAEVTLMGCYGSAAVRGLSFLDECECQLNNEDISITGLIYPLKKRSKTIH